jgi:hypothetical protein
LLNMEDLPDIDDQVEEILNGILWASLDKLDN